MTEHEICRLNLQSAVRDMEAGDSRRRVRAEVTGECVIGRAHHYWVKVSDTRPPDTGCRFPSGSAPGHARFMDYEVEACCRWEARTKALDQHARTFDRQEAQASS